MNLFGENSEGALPLEELDLSKNKLIGIPHEDMGYFSRLRKLNLDSNRLAGALSPSISCLANLEILSLEHNSLESLPSSILNCSKLVHLNLKNNCITRLPSKIFRYLTNLKHVDLSSNQFHYLPAFVENLKYLVHLNVSNNAHLDLTKLPKSLGNATHSKSSLPVYPIFGIFRSSSLVELDLGGVSIGPLFFSTLDNKNKDLILNMGILLSSNHERLKPTDMLSDSEVDNQLSSLFSDFWIGLQATLKNLNLSSTQLSAIPLGVFSLTKLESLCLSHNCIEIIPGQIENLKYLKKIDLSDNRIGSVSTQIGLLLEVSFF